jgi:hypothetical protein
MGENNRSPYSKEWLFCERDTGQSSYIMLYLKRRYITSGQLLIIIDSSATIEGVHDIREKQILKYTYIEVLGP